MHILKKQISFRQVILGLFILSISLNCHKKIDPEEIVVARVGKEKITVSDFRRNYEFGFAFLKKDPDRKRSYLDYMIKEKVLSLDGYRLGLDKSERVQKNEKDLLNELLVEEFFKANVNSKIKITPDQVRAAINKSKVKWKLRYWVEPTLDYANRVCQAMRQRGYMPVVDDILKSNPEIHLKPKDFETNYLSWLDVSDEMLDEIKNLPVGAISDPISKKGVYFIYQVVDIKREPVLSDYDYKDKYESTRQTLYYRELKNEATKYVSSYMTPKNVVTKGEAFRTLADALEEWEKQKIHSKKFAQAVINASQADSEKALLKLNGKLNETLVTFKGGSWTLNDFINRFDPKSVQTKKENHQTLRSKLNDQIALSVRDSFFTQEAKKRGLDKLPSVKKQLKEWRDKWVYEEARRDFTKDLTISDEQAKAYFDKFSNRYKIRANDKPKYKEFKNQAKRDAYVQLAHAELDKKVNSLLPMYPVIINDAVLDTITTIEFKKSRWATMQAFKQSSNRLAAPIVDPAWGF